MRVTASQVRKKLDEYFSSDGSAEPLLLEIPRGQYTPVFRERDLNADCAPRSTERVSLGTELPWLRTALAALLLVVVCLSIALVRQWRSPASRPGSTPALSALWANLFSPNRPTTVIVSDSSLALYEDLLGRQFSLSEYLAVHGSADGDPSLSKDPELAAFGRLTFGRALTSRASTNTVLRIAQLRNLPDGALLVVRPSDFKMDTLKFSNVILLGSPRANPWVELIEKDLSFQYTYDTRTKHSAFQDRVATPGQPQEFLTD